MKRHQLHKLQQRREFVQGRNLVGIDPAQHRHQAQILTPDGLPHGSSFSFSATFEGFHHRLWKHLTARLTEPLAHLSRHELAEHRPLRGWAWSYIRKLCTGINEKGGVS